MEPGSLSDLISRQSQKFVLTDHQPYLLKPHHFILARTVERVELPIDKGEPYLAARIEGKSSRARCGVLVHFTAPTVHPGWKGPLTLEMTNLGPTTFVLRPGMPIAQLIIEQVYGSLFENPSRFQNQATPEGLK
jgi:dCTP deaminase